jgi:hypothetical protein
MKIKIKEDWLAERPELVEMLREFGSVMRSRPFDNREGLRGISAFALYWFVKQIRPTAVFEVGVWRGFSTWIIEQAAPHAEVYCFDPIFYLEHLIRKRKVGRTYRSPRAHYSREEFSCAELEGVVARHGKPPVFFDDHQHKRPRLLQAKGFGIKEVIFDDNMPMPYSHRTLEQERQNPQTHGWLEAEIEDYEIFPPLWDVDLRLGDLHIKDAGLNFPVEKVFRDIHEDRKWYSYVTHVRLR